MTTNRYAVAKDADGTFHAQNMDTHVALCGATDFTSTVTQSNTHAVAAWSTLAGRKSSCPRCVKAAKAEYVASTKVA